MPYFDTVGDVVRVTMASNTASGQVQEMNVSMICQVAGGTDTRAAMNTVFDGLCTASIVPLLPASSHYFGSRVSFLKTAQPFAPTVTRLNLAGTGGGFPLPTQVRPLVSWRTGKAGRNYRGRIYLPTPSTTFLETTGHLTAAAVTIISAWAGFIRAPFVSAGSTWQPAIYHRHPTALVSDVATAITASETTTFFATQRRSGDFGRLNASPW
jgi:hypothetical protein